MAQTFQISLTQLLHFTFRLVTTTLSSLRTTACDALIVPSETLKYLKQNRY